MKVNNKQIKYDIGTYRRMRRAIGYLIISLPILLIGLSFISFFKTSLQPTISDYYYTNLREIFTAILCADGVLLICYKGHGNASIWKNDNLLTTIAGIMALCIAYFPTNPIGFSLKIYTLIPYPEKWLGWLHFSFATLLFLIMALLAINVFTIGQKNEIGINKSLFNENNVYRCCGYLILVCIVMAPLFNIFNLSSHNSTLFFETLSLFAFGTAWLIKGRALGDQGKIGRTLYRENNTTDQKKLKKLKSM